MRVANNHTFYPDAWVEIDLKLQRYATKHVFAVLPSLSHPILLGSDFLNAHNVVLDFAEGDFYFNFAGKQASEGSQWDMEPHARDPRTDVLCNEDEISAYGVWTNVHVPESIDLAPLNEDLQTDGDYEIKDINIMDWHAEVLDGNILTPSSGYSTGATAMDESTPKTQEKPGIEQTIYDGQVISIPGSNYVPESALDSVLPGKEGLLFDNLRKWTPMDDQSWSYSKEEMHPSSEEIRNMLAAEFPEVFSGEIGKTSVYEHCINTSSERTHYQSPYRYSPGKSTIIEHEVRCLLENGIIEQSKSPWASPLVLVTSEEATHRLCVDYRRLNAMTIPDAYPMPRLEDLLDVINGSTVFSTLDLKKGFWQIPMACKDREKTAFVTSRGLFHFLFMPFGLRNASATFQRTMNYVLAEYIGQCCVVYIDDILIFSRSMEEHIKHLRLIINRLEGCGFTLHEEKCQFLRGNVDFLGHVVDATGIRPGDKKISAILAIPAPTSVKKLKSFLGMIGYFRRFIENCSETSSPLHDLLKTGVKWSWGEKEENAFRKLKEALTTPPLLRHPNFDKEFRLTTDASSVGLGAVLEQKGDDGNYHPVAFASRALSMAEKRYTATELECLALVWSSGYFKVYLNDNTFEVRTDHRALQWLLNMKNANSRLTRWSLLLQGFAFKITHFEGRQNSAADALSRPFEDTTENVTPDVEMGIPLNAVTGIDLSEACSRAVEIAEEQRKDTRLNGLIQCLTFGTLPDDEQERKWVVKNTSYYEMFAGILYRRGEQFDTREGTRTRPSPTMVIPPSLIDEVIKAYHSSPTTGHLGIWKTLTRLRMKFYWEKMKKSVCRFVTSCIECQLYKSPKSLPVGKLIHLTLQEPWNKIAVDLMGPFPVSRSGNKFLLVVIDTMTKWVELFPLVNATSKTVARKLIDEVFCRFGTPREMISDNGPQFISELFKEMCRLFGSKQKKTTPYHPQSNPTERMNGIVGSIVAISAGKDHKTWDENLAFTALAIRTATSETMRESPAYLNFGREIRLPQDLVWGSPVNNSQLEGQNGWCETLQEKIAHALHVAKDYLQESSDKIKRNYDAARSEIEYSVGDKVLLRNHPRSDAAKSWSAKLSPKWVGPFTITKKFSPISYALRNFKGEEKNNHAVDLKRYILPSTPELDEQVESETEEAGEAEDESRDGLQSGNLAGYALPTTLSDNDGTNNERCAADDCQEPQSELVDWVQCDGPCDAWYHFVCVGYIRPADKEEPFFCSKCATENTARGGL